MSDLRFVSVMMFCGSCKSISRSNGRLMHLFVSDELPWSSFEKEKGERKNVIELHFISLQGELVGRCFPHYPHDEVRRSYGALNNGVLGGKRSTLLAVMARLLLDIETSNRFGNTCCDMPSLQYILHNVFFEKTFVGYPYNSGFYTQTVGPRGLAIEHKLEFG